MKKFIDLFLLFIISMFIICLSNCPVISSGNFIDSDSSKNNGTVKVWMTTIDQSSELTQQNDINFGNSGNATFTFTVNENVTYQQMDGFGASITESSAYVISLLSDTLKDNLMNKLFDRNQGIGISLLRQPMGSSDLSLSMYSYDDMTSGEDLSMDNFSIGHDITNNIIPLIKKALVINPNLKIIGTPWSAPGWMKTTGSLIGGNIKSSSYYQAYALYFLKFIQNYNALGVPIYAITLQGEPDNPSSNSPGMSFPANDEADFIKNNLGPIFYNNNIITKIMVCDHFWSKSYFATTVYDDVSSEQYVAGAAWHNYDGTAGTMTTLHSNYPSKDNWVTEGGQGTWTDDGIHGAGTWASCFVEGIKQIIQSTNNWAKSVICWNVALDQNGGPHITGYTGNYPMVRISDVSNDIICYEANYYAMGHISKFVMPKAFRINVNTYIDNVEAVAFKNPDNSKVLIIANRTAYQYTIKIVNKNNVLYYKVPGYAAITFTW